MPTIAETIIERAASYPERLAIVGADGVSNKYKHLGAILASRESYNIMTTGTTGVRKAVPLTCDQLLARMAKFVEYGGERFQGDISVFSTVGLTSGPGRNMLFATLLSGGTIYHAGRNTEPQKWLDMCQRYGVKTLYLYVKASATRDMMNANHPYRFEYVSISGGYTTRELLTSCKTAFGGEILCNYGTTEMGPIAYATYEEAMTGDGCVGRIIDGVSVKINANGLISIKHDDMIKGYFNNPAMTAMHFDEEGWFTPGDLGHMQDGLLYIDGRDMSYTPR